jgi:hypothetical protein
VLMEYPYPSILLDASLCDSIQSHSPEATINHCVAMLRVLPSHSNSDPPTDYLQE